MDSLLQFWNSEYPPSEEGRGNRQRLSNREDVIVVDGGGDNSNNEYNNNAAGSGNQNFFKVGEPSPNYRLGESFYTSHNYFRKESNNPSEAECLVCAEKQKEKQTAKRKRVMIKTPKNSPKGMLNHLFAVHRELKEKILKQKDAHEEKKKLHQKEREENEKKKGDSMKQQKLDSHGGSLAVEPRHDPQMQKRFDKAVVQFAAKTGVSFQALSKGNIDILIKPFFSKSTPKIKGRHKQTISRHSSKEALNIQRDIYSIVLSSKQDCLSYGITSDMLRDKALDSISLTLHFITNDGELVRLVPFCQYFGKRKHTGINIKISLADMLKALGLEDEKYDKTVVLDNAKNNKCAIRLSPTLVGAWCGIHSLQSAVKVSVYVLLSSFHNLVLLQLYKSIKNYVDNMPSNKQRPMASIGLVP